MFITVAAAVWVVADAACVGVIARANVARCALLSSEALRAQRAAVDAASAQRTAAEPLLPSNPVFEGSLALRSGQGSNTRALNWYATLRQELEIAGQRGPRMKEAEAFYGVAQQAAALSERDVASEAWLRYFEALAAQREVALVDELATSATFVAKAARAAAEQGVGSALDADVAEASLTRTKRALLAAKRRRFAAEATLQALLHTGPTVVEGSLTPLSAAVRLAAETGPTGSADPAVAATSPEVKRFELEETAFASRASLHRRLRVPNPALSLFVQNDGFDERVFGLGLSIPITLPQPLGRSHAGEIAEAEAQAERARNDAERARRWVALQVRLAQDHYRSRSEERAAFSAEQIERAHTQLRAMAAEIAAQRMPFREAALAQQALVDLLVSHLDAELQLCVASVQLVRLAGLPLDEEVP